VLVEEAHAAGEREGVVLTAPDTIAALQRIGAANRAASAATVVGVTGSSGKTSTKDVLAALVGAGRRTIAAEEGHNNEIGLPFTLTRIAADTEVAICELSMRGRGQITELAELARPEIGVITNIGEAHLELLGSREAIAAAKAELLDHVEIAVVPAGEPLLEPHLRDRQSVITFGEEAGADVRVAGRVAAPDRDEQRAPAGPAGVHLDAGDRRRRRPEPDLAARQRAGRRRDHASASRATRRSSNGTFRPARS